MLSAQRKLSFLRNVPFHYNAYRAMSHSQFFPRQHIDRFEYSVSFKGGNPEQRKNSPQQSFIMPISIGQPVHENEKMAGTLKFVNRHFKSGYILIDDVIQRHTLRILHPEKSMEDLYKRCLQDGDNWIKRNNHLCEKLLTLDYKIIRWERWLQHEQFQETLETIRHLRKENAAYQAAFNQSIDEFINRILKRDLTINYDWAYQCCLEYLDEECAAMFLWPELGVDVEVYPSKNRNQAMSATEELLIRHKYGKPLPHVGLRFHKVNPSSQVEEKNRSVLENEYKNKFG